MSKKTITGLRLLQAISPFEEYFATVLDLEGPWTRGMLEAEWRPECEERGLMAWEGSCTIELEPIDDGDALESHSFRGSWRRLTDVEIKLLGSGFRPFSGKPMPPDADHLISITDP